MQHLNELDRTRCKYPQSVVFVTTRGQDGVANTMPASMCMLVSHDPYMVAVSISPDRYTYACIRSTGRFIVSWAGADQAGLIRRTSRSSGRDLDKFDRFAIAFCEGPKTGLSLIEGCSGHLECELADDVAVGDHAIFIGRVLGVSVPDEPIRPLTRFGWDEYAEAIPRSEHKEQRQ